MEVQLRETPRSVPFKLSGFMTTDLLPAGTRINYSGHLGTVKFVGSILNSPGTWLGVEWDDPQRGKHDGVKDGRKYFTCL
jgi:tubulin-specific chaperone E